MRPIRWIFGAMLMHSDALLPGRLEEGGENGHTRLQLALLKYPFSGGAHHCRDDHARSAGSRFTPKTLRT